VVNEFGGASERKETRSLKSPQVRGGKLALDMARFPDRFSLRAVFTGAYFLEIDSVVASVAKWYSGSRFLRFLMIDAVNDAHARSCPMQLMRNLDPRSKLGASAKLISALR